MKFTIITALMSFIFTVAQGNKAQAACRVSAVARTQSCMKTSKRKRVMVAFSESDAALTPSTKMTAEELATNPLLAANVREAQRAAEALNGSIPEEATVTR